MGVRARKRTYSRLNLDNFETRYCPKPALRDRIDYLIENRLQQIMFAAA